MKIGLRPQMPLKCEGGHHTESHSFSSCNDQTPVLLAEAHEDP